MDKPRVANLNELANPMERSNGTRYASRHFALGPLLGAQKLGLNVTELPPGKAAFPYHFHHVNEELFLILAGEGTLRWPAGQHPLKPGDLVSCPPGPDGAHQIVNTGQAVLRYLALSTTHDPEVVEYPDSGKYLVTAGRRPGMPLQDVPFGVIAYKNQVVDYWAGEE